MKNFIVGAAVVVPTLFLAASVWLFATATDIVTTIQRPIEEHSRDGLALLIVGAVTLFISGLWAAQDIRKNH